jgi:hypothetical protein
MIALRRLTVLLVILITAGSQPLFSQEERTLSGQVETVTDGEPIQGVLVFAAGTSLRTSTVADGSFSIAAPPQAVFNLAVVAPGYEMQTIRIQQVDEPLVVRLEASGTAEPPSPTSGPDESMLSILGDALFLNCGSCRFVNPEVLVIESAGSGALINASASAPFTYENPDLGYRVTWHGFHFAGDPITPSWEGASLFSEMEGSERDVKKWNKERQEVYEGTLRHFLKALAEERVEKEYFAAYHVAGWPSMDNRTPIAEMGRKGFGYNTILPVSREGFAPGMRRLMFSGWLYITSREDNGAEPGKGQIEEYWPPELREGIQRGTWIYLPFAETDFDPTGVLLHGAFSERVRLLGLMSFDRWNTLLPNDWMPKD